MCGNERVRYVHHVDHKESPYHLDVGCICAEKMSGDYVTPRAAEARLRAKARTKSHWLDRQWRASYSGNPRLKVEGFYLTVFRNKYKPDRWSFSITSDEVKEYSRTTFANEDEAKLAVFDAFWALKKDWLSIQRPVRSS